MSEISKSFDQSPPSFGEALRFWSKLGWISFGGPAGQIAIMHRELVERRRWLTESHFLHALNFCMLLPGPEAQQLATYLGKVVQLDLGFSYRQQQPLVRRMPYDYDNTTKERRGG